MGDLNKEQQDLMYDIMGFEARNIEVMWRWGPGGGPWNTLLTFEGVKGEGPQGEITDNQVSNMLTQMDAERLLARKTEVMDNIKKMNKSGPVDIKKAMEKWVELFYEGYFGKFQLREAVAQEISLLEKLFKWAERKRNPSEELTDEGMEMLETINEWPGEKQSKFGLIVSQIKKMAEYHYNFGWTFDVLKEYLDSVSSIIQKRFRAYKEGTLTRKSLGIFTGSEEVKNHDWEELKEMMEAEGFTTEEIEYFYTNHYIARAKKKRKKTKKKKKNTKKKNIKKKNIKR